jgi:maltooligosyltrehalose trehalohydrolase
MMKQAIYPTFDRKNRCVFRLWAPLSGNVSLVLFPEQESVAMEKNKFGYWEKTMEGVEPGTRYKYRINDGDSFPDPASLSQPEGVHGPSRVIRLDHSGWTDRSWKNIPLADMILYELHTGTFSPEGNFEGIRSRLDYLKDLGINAIEIMPVARFSGARNWGYDGVYPFAVHDAYGGAKGLMDLVNACHREGIAVILDVVYNHFGPEGNYATRFGHYYAPHYSTPWGHPINFDGPYSDAVRDFFIQNALMWCRDFHMDGLRLDAVHAIYDLGAKHIMRELAENMEKLSGETGRKHYLIAESNLNDVRYISSFEKGGYGLDAQWSDDFHHAIHALVTGERDGYYMDFGEPAQLSRAIRDIFVFDGKYSAFRKKTYGNSPEHHPGEQFVVFSQNHDQTGNRKKGERLVSLTDLETAKLVAGTMFLAPSIPMLFMGEEYGERNPFLYFVSHLDDRLNEEVRKGREKEFASFQGGGEPAPDPASPATFNDSKLSWHIREDREKQAMLDYYRQLIRLRREHPVLHRPDRKHLHIHETGQVFLLERWSGRSRIFACMNYSPEDRPVSVPSGIRGKLGRILDSASERWSGPGDLSPGTVTAGDQFGISRRSIVIYTTRTA